MNSLCSNPFCYYWEPWANTRQGRLGIDFDSGFRKKNPGIHFYSGFREKKHKGGGVQFEILKNPGIDFYSGFRKTSQGGGGGCKSNS